MVSQIIPDLEKEIKQDLKERMEQEYKQKIEKQQELIKEEAQKELETALDIIKQGMVDNYNQKWEELDI